LNIHHHQQSIRKVVDGQSICKVVDGRRKKTPHRPTIMATTSAPPTNPRGIPYAPFIDRIEDYVSTKADVESTLQSFQEMISQRWPQADDTTTNNNSKYQFMQSNNQQRISALKSKLPDLEKTLDSLRFLLLRRSSSHFETIFELNDTLYAKAEISSAGDHVFLWLGANVMLAYPLVEAEELLVNKLSAAKKSLENCEEDVDFLREQITTMEVATARVYNWDVGMRRKEKVGLSS
ncbi:hypothetical protein AC579_2845, partial [Pseudocercospora musae]